MKKFFTTADRQARGYDDASGLMHPLPRPRPRGSDPADYSIYNTASTPVAIPHTPSSLLPPPKTTPQEKDDGGPFKQEMVARMDELQRGERVVPPCDRCRRLQMDCLKNLTACLGCTKKHAKCSWRDVKEEELRAAYGTAFASNPAPRDHGADDRDNTSNHPNLTPSNHNHAPPAEHPRETLPPFHHYQSCHTRRESAPGAPRTGPDSGALMGPPSSAGNSPRRAMSDTDSNDRVYHRDRLPHGNHSTRHAEEEDPDANQRLMQAILDTVDHHARIAAAVQEKERGAERGPEDGNGRDADREREKERDRDRERRLVQA